jgi:hypothetical protein
MTRTTKIAAVSGDDNAAVLSERMRISAILESVEGKRNPELASELALRTSLDIGQARGILAKAPAANPYIAAMNREGPIDGLGSSAATADFSNDPKAARLKEIGISVANFNSERRGGKSIAKVG